MSRYYDRQGNPISMMEWCKKFEDNGYKRVSFDKLENCYVSTVWLGVDHNFLGGNPLIFETLVFGGPLDGEMYRYHTEEEAIKGHEEMVTHCKSKCGEKP